MPDKKPEPKPLDIRVLRNGVKRDEFQTTVDPDDHAALEKKLKAWLEGNDWHPARWKEFEAEVRPAGKSGPVTKVRV